MSSPVQTASPSIDLQGLPLGYVFDPRIPWDAERRHMPGWSDPFNTTMFPSMNWRVVDDESDGQRSMEFPYKRDGALLFGERDWRDVTIEADVRHFHATSLPFFDDEYMIVSRSGLILRQQDARRYYTLCFEGLDRIVLYRRWDDKWTALAQREMKVDHMRYYRLRFAAEGNRLRCEMDGEPLFDVRHDAYAAGLCGIRTNVLSRYRNVAVTHEPEAVQRLAVMRSRERRELDELRERNPKPVLAKTIKLPVDMTTLIWPGRLRNGNTNDLVVIPRDIPNYVTFRRLIGVSQEGEQMWEVIAKVDSLEGAKLHAFGGTTVCDVDGDGLDEVITAYDGMIKILRGRDGKVLNEAPLPQSGVYSDVLTGIGAGDPRGKFRFASIFPARWKKGGGRKGFVLMEEYPSCGGNCIVALDENLREMWRRYVLPVNYGHTVEVWDIDGDGRDEIIAGYVAINADGDTVWRMEGLDAIDDEWGARHHPDCVAVGDFAGNGGLQLAVAGGTKGFYIADARTGAQIAFHKPGHVQWVWGARMFTEGQPDAMQIVTNTLHGNPGIVGVYSPRGELLSRWQMDNENSFTPPVNWSGTGEHLVPLTCNDESFGLYDARGRKVVDRWMTPEELAKTHGGPVLRMNVRPFDLLNEGRDQLLMLMFGEIRVYAQDKPAPGGKPYRTRRRNEVWPLVSFPA